MFRLSLLFLAALCGPALACPQSIPATSGLVLVESDVGTRNHYVQTPEGLLQHRLTLQGEIREESEVLYAHPITAIRLTNASGTTEVVYGAQVEDLDRIDSLGEWRTDVLLKRGGKVLAVGVEQVTFLGPSSVTIDTCTYATWAVEERMELTGYDPIIFEKHYAPALGLVLRSIQKSVQGAVMSEVAFQSIAPGP